MSSDSFLLKNIGPFESNFIKMIRSKKIGESKIKPINAQTVS
jgi:hypothetical protein